MPPVRFPDSRLMTFPFASVSLSPSLFVDVPPAFVDVLPPAVPPRFPEERLMDFVEPDGFFVVFSLPDPAPEPLQEDAPALS